MRIAVLSDIRGNLSALNAVLADAEERHVDQRSDRLGESPADRTCLMLRGQHAATALATFTQTGAKAALSTCDRGRL